MTTVRFHGLHATASVDESHRFEPGGLYEVHPTKPEGSPLFFVLTVHGERSVVAMSESAQALSRLAFGRGAQEVRHDYDLRLAEGR